MQRLACAVALSLGVRGIHGLSFILNDDLTVVVVVVVALAGAGGCFFSRPARLGGGCVVREQSFLTAGSLC